MQSRWSDQDAARMVSHYASQGVGPDLALRVYTSRLLGGDRKLVLHGGGNTSVKTVVRDLIGDEVEVLCVKGSGWDMAAIEPAGLPAVRLAPLRRLRARASLSDEEMVRVQRANLIDPGAPNPSVETLLHAFLPHKFVDHTHSSAVLSLADQPDGEARCAELYGGRLGLVPYIMPGFQLAKKAAEVFEADPEVEGLVLLKHGIFTFAETAREAYERMITAVTLAEEQLARGRNTVVFPAARSPIRPKSHPFCAAPVPSPRLSGPAATSGSSSISAPIRQFSITSTAPSLRAIASGAWLRRITTCAQKITRCSCPHRQRDGLMISNSRWVLQWTASSPSITPISPATTRGKRSPNASSIRCRGSSSSRVWGCLGWGQPLVMR